MQDSLESRSCTYFHLQALAHESSCVSKCASAVWLQPLLGVVVATSILKRDRRLCERRPKTLLRLSRVFERAFSDKQNVRDDAKRPYVLLFPEVSLAAKNFRTSIIQTKAESIRVYLTGRARLTFH